MTSELDDWDARVSDLTTPEPRADHLGRDERDFAIEHAGYLADSVDRLLRADRSIIDAEEWLELNERVYEFRKRKARI